MSLGIAFRAFFAALGNRQAAVAIGKVLAEPQAALAKLEQEQKRAEPVPAVKAAPVPPPPARGEAVTLLATLQREARLIDLAWEPLDQYTDAQVGAAARPCLKQCQQTLRRIFDLAPLLQAEEGTRVDVPQDASPFRYQWLGERTGASATLVHPGWIARKSELAQWTGKQEDAGVVAPAQVSVE